MLNDLRFAFRMISTRPWFSAAVIVTLALGIGINTTVFTLVEVALIKPVPIPNGERLVAVLEEELKNPREHHRISYPDFRDFREQNHSFERLEALSKIAAVVSDDGNTAERYELAEVTAGLFGMLETPPAKGRMFTDADTEKGAAPVVMIGYDVWQKRYGGDPSIMGRTLHINGNLATVVGVMPQGFRFPSNQDLWMPLTLDAGREDRRNRDLMVFGLLERGSSIPSAQADLSQLSKRLAATYPDIDGDSSALVQSFHQAFNGGPIELIFLLMLGAVGFVLLIACANVANMMLSRAQSRKREISVRAALGASRWRIVRLLLVESVLLSLLGGVLGLVISHYGVAKFESLTQDVGKPYWVIFAMDWRAFAYFSALSVLTGLVFGSVPALRASRVDLNSAMKDGAPGGTLREGRLASSLVVLQFALTVILLSGAGAMIRSLISAQRINNFVPASHLLTARVSLPDQKGEPYETVDSRRRMHARLMERLTALPGVTEAALASDMPGMGSQTRDVEFEGAPNPDPKQPPRAAAVFATPNYLDAIRLPLLLGRGLSDDDGLPGRESCVVTRAFSSRYWPNGGALGRRFRFLDDGKPGAWITVVGVCGDLVQDTMDRNPAPLVYLSNKQEPWAWLGILLRTNGDPAGVTLSLRRAIQDIDPELPLFEVRTLHEAIEHQYWFLKTFGGLFLVFAVVALLMASVGIYAVVAQASSRRTREIGIRVALGATSRQVVGLTLSRGLAQLGAGLLVGLLGAYGCMRLMVGIPGLSTGADPLLFTIVVLALFGVGTLACWIPARGAAKVAPTEALRAD